MKKNNLSPIQKIQQEKKDLKRLYEADGERLSENWDYLTNNIGTLTLNTLFKSTKNPSGKPESSSSSLASKIGGHPILSSLSLVLPIVWEIAQPMLFSYMIKKVKSLFSSKKKETKKKKSFSFF